jgi:hypothetical protein
MGSRPRTEAEKQSQTCSANNAFRARKDNRSKITIQFSHNPRTLERDGASECGTQVRGNAPPQK